MLLEGGATLAGAFRDAGELDELRLFYAPLVLGGDDAGRCSAGRRPGSLVRSGRWRSSWEPSGEDMLAARPDEGVVRMFTGLISEIGSVEAIERGDAGARCGSRPTRRRSSAAGDSVAVAGACLTARSRVHGGFDADVMNQTLELTALGRLEPGSPSTSSRIRASDRLGGHIVQGHVDATGTVVGVAEDGFARRVRIAASRRPRALRRRARLDRAERGQPHGRRRRGRIVVVSLIPETLERTTFGDGRRRRSGQRRGRCHRPARRASPARFRGERWIVKRRRVPTRIESPFTTIDEAIEEIRRGRMVVVCDDEDRENEGDLVMAAQFATPEAVNFMATHGRGLICLALTAQRCDELDLNLMAAKNEAPLQTAFTVSIEAAEGVTTGISAARPGADRSRSRSTPARSRATSASPATSSRCKAQARAASSSAPATPRRASISPASPASTPPA